MLKATAFEALMADAPHREALAVQLQGVAGHQLLRDGRERCSVQHWHPVTATAQKNANQSLNDLQAATLLLPNHFAAAQRDVEDRCQANFQLT